MRVLQLTGAGDVFCAGADLAEMQSQAQASEADNVAHAEKRIALVVGIDRPLDMCRSTVNTIGNLVGASLVARTERE